MIEIKLQGVLTNALLDSGSEVTCISEEFYLRNSERLQKCPKLPISKLSVVGATGGRPVSVKSQLYVEMTIENFTECHTFVIIPKLKRECIIGVDLLKKLRGNINFEIEKLQFRNKEEQIQIKFQQDNGEDDMNQIEAIENNWSISGNLKRKRY